MEKAEYIIPEVTTYTEAEILAELGEAHAYLSNDRVQRALPFKPRK